MKIAVIGSRSLVVTNLHTFLPENCSEIVSGGAVGIDRCAKEYAIANRLKLTEFLPEYERYQKRAPLMRNRRIIDYADSVLAFWDGTSKGTRFVIETCRELGKPCTVIYVKPGNQGKNFADSIDTSTEI